MAATVDLPNCMRTMSLHACICTMKDLCCTSVQCPRMHARLPHVTHALLLPTFPNIQLLLATAANDADAAVMTCARTLEADAVQVHRAQASRFTGLTTTLVC
jgi:hypothetical protein